MPEDIFTRSGNDEDKEYEKMLKKVGYRCCQHVLHDFGVPTAKEIISNLIETAEDPQLENWENERVEILNQAIQIFINSAKSNIIDRYMQFLSSPLDKESQYMNEDEEFDSGFNPFDDSVIGRISAWDVIYRLENNDVPPLAIRETGYLQLKEGKGRIELDGFTQLFPDNIFLKRKMLKGDFLGALFTWAHEFAHNISGQKDFTAGFTDAERYLHELLLITSFNSDELKELQSEWNDAGL